MKKILIIQNIHESGIEILKKNSDYEFQIIEDINSDELKKKLLIVMLFL